MRPPRNFAPTLEELESRDCPTVIFSAFSSGIWAYDDSNGSFRQTTPFRPVAMATSSGYTGTTLDHYLVAAFVGFGTYQYDANLNQWSQITSYTAKLLTTSPAYSDPITGAQYPAAFYASFDSLGIWKNSLKTWTQISPIAADKLVSIDGTVFGAFSLYGTWRWDSSTGWQQIAPYYPTAFSRGGGNLLYASYAGFGTYSYNIFSVLGPVGWQQITPAVATTLEGDFEYSGKYGFLSTFVGSFPGYGTFYYGAIKTYYFPYPVQFQFLTSELATQLYAIPSEEGTHAIYGGFTSGFWVSTDHWTPLAGEAPYLIAQGY
jgi:hypothetical protein